MAMFPLGITAELLINGTWRDASTFVLQRDGITITGGRQDWNSQAQPAQLTLTLDNTDGRFSPLYSGGAYFPFLQRGTQIRVAVTATSSSGNFYSGYRFTGEVLVWPPLSDISGNDVYVQVTANGPLRRIRAGGGKGSALTRYYATLTGTLAPIAYWACEEDPDTDVIGSGIEGGTNMAVVSGSPTWKAIGDFNGSAPVGVLNGSVWDGLTGSFGSSGDDVYLVPGTYTWYATTTTVNAKVWNAGGGGEGGSVGRPGGGGEFCQETALAVTIGNPYTVVVGAGGRGGTPTIAAQGGQSSSMTGDSVTVTGGGGQPGASGSPGAGGTGSVNGTHHNGGAGFSGSAGGGGGSGGTAAAGNTGGTHAGAAAVTGGGPGGAGNTSGNGSAPASGPGGGGGGGANVSGTASGGPGYPGKVELVYTPGAVPPANVLRFILMVPAHGGNRSKCLVRALTSGTIATLEVAVNSASTGLVITGYLASTAVAFSAGLTTPVNGQTLMVSAELTPSGANVGWKLTVIVPGAAAAAATTSGVYNTASLGNVSEVLAGPNGDITKTAIGHISVQYALADITAVSKALHGHHTEMSIDRFIRLCNEQAIDNVPQFNETADHWGFEGWTFTCAGTPLNNGYFIATTAHAAEIRAGDILTSSVNGSTQFRVTALSPPFAGFVNVFVTPSAGTTLSSPSTVTTVPAPGVQGWTAVNGAVAQSPTWFSEGRHSLKLTANGGGNPSATSPTGVSGQPVAPGDIVSFATDLMSPGGISNAYAGLSFWTGAGALIGAEHDTADAVLAAGVPATIKHTFTAPATSATFSTSWGNHHADANNTLLYGDHVRVTPRMGPQTRKELHRFLEEIEALDAGILFEAKHTFGLGYRTRISLISQAAQVTLDYSQGMLSPPLTPVIDDQKLASDVIVHRHKGSKVRVTNALIQPGGPNWSVKTYRMAAETDAQLLALAQHLLNLGNDTHERFPTVTVNLARASRAGDTLAPLMSAVASAEIGDRIVLSNLPFFFPTATASQLIIGYTERISPREWTLTWNCIPESPYAVTGTLVRRW